MKRQTHRIFLSLENQLIQLYLFVCQTYDKRSETCFQRLSNNSNPAFTDQELVSIWFFGHLNHKFNKRQIYDSIQDYWAKVACEMADVGYCATKKIYFHGVRLYTTAQRRFEQIPNPSQI